MKHIIDADLLAHKLECLADTFRDNPDRWSNGYLEALRDVESLMNKYVERVDQMHCRIKDSSDSSYFSSVGYSEGVQQHIFTDNPDKIKTFSSEREAYKMINILGLKGCEVEKVVI